MPVQHLHGALGYHGHWVIPGRNWRKLGTAQLVLAIWHINIILGGETLQDISVSHLNSVAIFLLSSATDYLTERYPGYLKIPQ